MRAAIIGCGPGGPGRGGAHSIAYAHARAMRKTTMAIDLVAVASRSEKNLADFCQEFSGVIGYQDYHELLSRENPEFVSVCAFPPDREEMVNAAIQTGARVIWVEKPFAISAGAARRMVSAAAQVGARIFVNFQRRYGRPFEWVKENVQSGRIGKLYGAQIVQPGNVLMNFGPHLIDAVIDILDVPQRRKSVAVLAAVEWQNDTYQGVPAEAQMVGTVHFSDGTRLVVEAGRKGASEVPVIRIDGEEGFAELRLSPVEGERGVARARFRDEAEISTWDGEENFHHGTLDGNLYVNRAVEDILCAVHAGTPCRLDVSTVQPGLEILLGLFESAKQGRMIEFPSGEDGSPFFGGKQCPPD